MSVEGSLSPGTLHYRMAPGMTPGYFWPLGAAAGFALRELVVEKLPVRQQLPRESAPTGTQNPGQALQRHLPACNTQSDGWPGRIKGPAPFLQSKQKRRIWSHESKSITGTCWFRSLSLGCGRLGFVAFRSLVVHRRSLTLS